MSGPEPPRISSYRFGDLLAGWLTDDEKDSLARDHPASLGARLIQQWHPEVRRRIEQLAELVVHKIAECTAQLPPRVTDSTVVHLRLGDVVCGTHWHEQNKRPLPASALVSAIPQDAPVLVIGQCFFTAEHSSMDQYDDSRTASAKYLAQVLADLHATHVDGGHADMDLCCGVAAKTFVAGKGHFSGTILAIRKVLGKPSILPPGAWCGCSDTTHPPCFAEQE